MGSVATTQRLKAWLIGLFVKAVNGISNDQNRNETIQWLASARDVVSSDQPERAKFIEIYKMYNTRKTLNKTFNVVAEGIRNYKTANLPLFLKVSIPVTILAAPFLGGQGVGVAALGGAVGVPALLLVFLGSSGITSIIEACTKGREAQDHVFDLASLIIQDEVLRRASSAMKQAMREEPYSATLFETPSNNLELQQMLFSMDPFDFERHVMGFFKESGMVAWTTKKTNDMGVDGFARHPDGLIVVQCKRYSADNLVGGPTVQQFKGVIEDNKALRGYLVTTSDFTKAARLSAGLSDRVVLVGMDELLSWHEQAPALMEAPL